MKEIERKALELACQWYKPETLQHAIRVANYAAVMVNESVKYDEEDDPSIVYATAILHDILEDTGCPLSKVQEVFCGLKCYQAAAIEFLTKSKEDTYDDYIHKILNSGNKYAILVKRADFKDHLSQVDSLTPKLIEKYKPYMGKFM